MYVLCYYIDRSIYRVTKLIHDGHPSRINLLTNYKKLTKKKLIFNIIIQIFQKIVLSSN